MMDSSSSPSSRYHGSSKSGGSSSYSVWSNFFLAAGIPAAVANEYAVTFSQHRIQINMLKEINKEILLDMGIKAMGDIIAILRHAKDLCTQDELKSGGLKVASLEHGGDLSAHLHLSQQVPSINQRTSVTTARLGPSISSLVGSKVSSRSVAAAATTGELARNPASSITQSVVGKRPSNISYLESKRLRLDQQSRQQQHLAPVAEKTLTVKYPSAEAMAKVQQRMSEARAGANRNPNNLSGIKSRLGATHPRIHTSTASHNNSTSSSFASPPKREWQQQQQQQQQRRPNHIGNGGMNHNNSNHHHHKNPPTQDNTTSKYSANRKSNVFARDDVMRTRTDRLKSTVFNRLGEGPG